MLSSIKSANPGASAWRLKAPLRETPRLKVCLISETAITGVGRHVTDVIKAMTARGHEIHLLHSIARCDETLLGELDHLSGFRRRAFPMRRRPHWSDVPVLIALARYLQRFGPFDVIHGHSSKGGVYARLLGLVLPGACLYTPHAFVTMAPHLTGPKRAAYAAIERSLALCHQYRDLRFPRTRRSTQRGSVFAKNGLRVIPNAITPFDASGAPGLRAQLGLPPDAAIIGFVGRLDEQKAPRVLVEAAAMSSPVATTFTSS